ncbi:MAG: hypothetical protein Q9161_007756 [Pseudevernia consocians]
MPSKYSHALVLSQQQYRDIINIDRPLSLKPPSSHSSRSHNRSFASSSCSPSNHSNQSSGYSSYLRLEPDPESEPSYDYRSSTHTVHPYIESTPSDAPRFESTSSELSRPPSDRLRLESPFGFRIGNPPSPPPELEPTLSEYPHHEITPSHRPNSESPLSERLPPESPSPFRSGDPRPSLHHKSSSVETQIYAPNLTTSPPPSQDGQKLFPVKTNEPSSSFRHPTSPASTQERQHVFSMESPEGSPPPTSTEDRQERFSSETQLACLPSPTPDRRQRFIQKTQAPASPPPEKYNQLYSPFGTQDSPLFPSARELQDYFSIATQGLQSTPVTTRDRQDFSSLKARSALPTPSQDDQVRPSLNTQRLQSPPQTQYHQRRPSLGTRHSSSERRPQATQESVHSRRQSIDSQTTRDLQHRPPFGPQRLSLDQSVKETQHRRRQSVDTKSVQERQPRPSISGQQPSLTQFIQESEHIREPSIDSYIHLPQSSSLYTGKSNSCQTTSPNAQSYTPKSTSLEHSPRSRRDRASKLPDTFASHHRILLPTSQGTYDNVLVETHGFPPECPPSPPATPDLSKSCSLTLQVEEPQKTSPPPPIPQRSARRSPPRQRSILRSTNSSVVNLPSEPPRPKTSSATDVPPNSTKAAALHSPTFSISTRRSSINATLSPQSVSFTNFSETMTSPRRVSFSLSRDREYFEDADLESLPSEIDFDVLPYEDPNVGPAIFRANQLGIEHPVSPRYEDPNAGPAPFHVTQSGLAKPVSHDRPALSRASSFDSAAPPPIGLNRRISHAVAESYQSRMPKKESRLSILSFLRSTPSPKAILYSEATQGKLPVPVSVSRTSVPSIPLLFPGYRGQFPPPQKMQDKGLRSGLDPRTRPGLDARASAPRSNAHADAAEKRKSWFKGDDVDKGRGASRPSNTWELERILSNL